MTGSNTMVINYHVLKEAIQHYFDTKLFAPGMAPRVGSIELGASGLLTSLKIETTVKPEFPPIRVARDVFVQKDGSWFYEEDIRAYLKDRTGV